MSYANPYEIINKSRSKWMAVEVQTGFRLCLESNALQAPPARKRGRASYALHSRQSLERERKHYPPKIGRVEGEERVFGEGSHYNSHTAVAKQCKPLLCTPDWIKMSIARLRPSH